MGAPDAAIAASLEAKLRAFVAGLTDDEATLLAAMVAAGAEVSGFEQSSDVPVVEPPRFSLLVSNVLKTRHDTAKNSISNVR